MVTDPGQYGPVLDELRRSDGALSDATRFRLAFEAFRRTAQYDAAIAAYLREPARPGAPPRRPRRAFPSACRVDGVLAQTLRYGENPHQAAAFYRPSARGAGTRSA